MDATNCYGGGDIAGAVIGTIIGCILLAFIIWYIFNKYWKNKKGTQLVVEDPENVKADFAFDNPSFKKEDQQHKTSSSSPLSNKLWNSGNNQLSLEKRKTTDGSHLSLSGLRTVGLRGSDFTGLGIEVCGGLKDGIFVKKVMPQGPAANIVNIGDKITSITIDFHHIAQEDASTILNSASPYNVQLELIDGKGVIPSTSGQSPTTMTTTNTSLLRESRLPIDDPNYPTLKLEQPIRSDLPVAHNENEKRNSSKQQFKEIMEEKLQNKSSQQNIIESNNANNNTIDDSHRVQIEKHSQSAVSPDDNKKGLKFGIRVLPPNIDDKRFSKNLSSQSSITQQVVDGNEKETVTTNMQSIQHSVHPGTNNDDGLSSPQPPPISKRVKNKMDETNNPNRSHVDEKDLVEETFQRQNSLTSSGIKRDSAGVPQEVPNFMMQAALAARDYRKNIIDDSMKKVGKGKAPKPPPNNEMMDISYDESIDSNNSSSIDVPDNIGNVQDAHITSSSAVAANKSASGENLNFTDNFTDEVLSNSIFSKMNILNAMPHKGGITSTPDHHIRHTTHSNDVTTEDSPHEDDIESDSETSSDRTQIQLNTNHVTVHQNSSSTIDADERSRKAASLGDLSKYDMKIVASGVNRLDSLERAQSLEITDNTILSSVGTANSVGSPSSPTAIVKTPTKRKATAISDTILTGGIGGDGSDHIKEPRLMESVIISNSTGNTGKVAIDSLQRNRLKSAYEWGNLEDAIYSNNIKSSNISNFKDIDDDNSKIQFTNHHHQQHHHESSDPVNNIDIRFGVDEVDEPLIVPKRHDYDITHEDCMKKYTIENKIESKLHKMNEKFNDLLGKTKETILNEPSSTGVTTSTTTSEIISVSKITTTAVPSTTQLSTFTTTSSTLTTTISGINSATTTATTTTSSTQINMPIKFDLTQKFKELDQKFIDATTSDKQPKSITSISSISSSSTGNHFDYDMKPNDNHITISPVIFNYKTDSVITTTTGSSDHHYDIDVDDKKLAKNENESDHVKIINYGVNIPDDIKVTRYPFGSLERPKSDVLKKVAAAQHQNIISGNVGNNNNNNNNIMVGRDMSPTKMMNMSQTTTTIYSESPLVSIDGTSYTTTEISPHISLTTTSSNTGDGGGGSVFDQQKFTHQFDTTSDKPIYSSSDKGVNSINISSFEVNISPASSSVTENTVTTNTGGANRMQLIDNFVNIKTIEDTSQPTSLILIDDGKSDSNSLEFMVNNNSNKQRSNKEEVFVIESLSSMKLPESDYDVQKLNNTKIPSPTHIIDKKTFVTEIRVDNRTNNNTDHISGKNTTTFDDDTDFVDRDDDYYVTDKKIADNKHQKIVQSTVAKPINFLLSNFLNNERKFMDNEKETIQAGVNRRQLSSERYLPRNSEIKFTTSTYESPHHIMQQHFDTTRHIDQIRSNFERNQQSEIPLPVRKSISSSSSSTITSPPSSLRTSPSKIPVFNSTSKLSPTTIGTTTITTLNDSHNTNNSNSPPKTNGNVNRVSVSVTSIKNQSRNPSGK